MLNQSINRPLVLRYMPRREVLYLTSTWTDRPTDRPATGSFFFLSFFFLSYFRVGKIGAACARVDEGGVCEDEGEGEGVPRRGRRKSFIVGFWIQVGGRWMGASRLLGLLAGPRIAACLLACLPTCLQLLLPLACFLQCKGSRR